jgi:hypothetical protein
MADNTGAPWLLPYPESTDLVRDGAQDIEALATAVASGLTAANTGIGTNVVQAVKTDPFTSTSTSFVAVDGLAATITPKSLTSKILVVVQVSLGLTSAGSYGMWKVTRGGTDIYRGDAAGNRVRSVLGGFIDANLRAAIMSNSIVILDSPATDTATIYRVEARKGASGGGLFVNRSELDSDTADFARGASSITVIEVAA